MFREIKHENNFIGLVWFSHLLKRSVRNAESADQMKKISDKNMLLFCRIADLGAR